MPAASFASGTGGWWRMGGRRRSTREASTRREARMRLTEAVRSALSAIGANALRSLLTVLGIVTPGNVTQGGARLGAGAASTLTDEDAAAIRREIEGVTAAAPFVRGGV